jgi:tetratricopeptide (TPR) repeat protein
MREAFRHYDAGVRRMEETGNPELPIPRVAQRARVRMVALGDTAGALSELSAALDRLPADANLSRGWIQVGVIYALAGDTARPEQALDALRRTGRGNWSGTRGVLGAALALARGDPRKSLDLLAESETPCTFDPPAGGDHRQRRILAGRAYEALGLPDSAIAEYEAYFKDPLISYPVPLDAAFRFDTFERLGRLYEARGDSSRAAMYYVRAADLWKESDPDLQGRVREQRARAAALARGAARGQPLP